METQRSAPGSPASPDFMVVIAASLTDKITKIMKFRRITIDPRQMGGIPCIRRLRIPVATVVGMVAGGMTQQQILEAYPDLKPKDIEEALLYAAESVRERQLPLRSAS